MLKVNVDKLDKMAMHGAEDDLDRKVTGNFALCSAAGTKSGAAVYFELEPGKELRSWVQLPPSPSLSLWLTTALN